MAETTYNFIGQCAPRKVADSQQNEALADIFNEMAFRLILSHDAAFGSVINFKSTGFTHTLVYWLRLLLAFNG
jgi:hypothetical protein